ncbi:MAG: hypothetical protein F6K65_20425 [Moorea sp. SIO3C2]|nr:hypothetical protein [Moorena sp. SIO3C2]
MTVQPSTDKLVKVEITIPEEQRSLNSPSVSGDGDGKPILLSIPTAAKNDQV